MDFDLKTDQQEQQLSIRGRFTFADYQKFRELIEKLLDAESKRYTIDLRELEFIDSAGLGMLLLARDEAQRKQRGIALRRPSGQVRRVIDVARFDTLFEILE